ncbi:MAG TPA: hypothetical protein VFC19_28375, partial [Candidatus Limnocylindrales bacterium]|nr:hypothetical protein [Candidatus Limnocylindrales bacterium]
RRPGVRRVPQRVRVVKGGQRSAGPRATRRTADDRPAAAGGRAAVVVDAALGPPPAVPTVETVAAGTRSLRLAPMLSIIIGALNEWRVARGLVPTPLS